MSNMTVRQFEDMLRRVAFDSELPEGGQGLVERFWLNRARHCDSSTGIALEAFLEDRPHQYAIEGAFSWPCSPEGHAYWSNINRQYVAALRGMPIVPDSTETVKAIELDASDDTLEPDFRIRYLSDNNDIQISCDSCGAYAPVVEYEAMTEASICRGPGKTDTVHLCRFCFSTTLPNRAFFPDQSNPETSDVLRQVAVMHNVLLGEIEKLVGGDS